MRLICTGRWLLAQSIVTSKDEDTTLERLWRGIRLAEETTGQACGEGLVGIQDQALCGLEPKFEWDEGTHVQGHLGPFCRPSHLASHLVGSFICGPGS